MKNKEYLGMLTMIALLTVLNANSVVAETFPILIHEYNEINVFDACSYYRITDFSALNTFAKETLRTDSKNEVIGKVKNGIWEYEYIEAYTVQVLDKIIPYEVEECIVDNKTMKLNCIDVTYYNQTYKDEIRYSSVWMTADSLLNDFSKLSGIRLKSTQNVRYCADIERVWNPEGFTVRVDIIPYFDGTVYSRYEWFNSSWTYRRDISITNNNDTYVIEQGYSINHTFDHASLVTAGKSLANGTDIRIVCGDIELDRINETAWNTATTQVWFNWTGENISTSSTNTTWCDMYYDDEDHPNPPNNTDNIYILYEDFEKMTNGSAVGGQRDWDNANSQVGVITNGCNAGQCAYQLGESSGESEAYLNKSFTPLSAFAVSFYWKGKINAGSRFILEAFMREGTSGWVRNDGNTWSRSRIADGTPTMFAIDGSTDVSGGSIPADDTWYRFEIFVTQDSAVGDYIITPGATSGTQALATAISSAVDNFILNNENTAREQKELWYDDIIIRRHLSPEPTTVLGEEETFSENTSLLAVPFDIDDFSFSSATFVPGIFVQFNTTKPSTNLSVLSSMNVEKISGGGTSIISARILLDDSIILTENLRTVTGTGTVGSTGLSPIRFNVANGEHNITVEFARTGGGSILIDNIDFNLLEFESSNNNSIRSQLVNVSYSFSSQTFTDAFNWTMSKLINSSTYIIFKQTVSKVTAGLAELGFRFFNFQKNDTSPSWFRTLSSASDIGSLSGVYIDPTETGTHNHTVQSKQSDVGDTVSVNGTILDFDLSDSSGIKINQFQETNESINESNTVLFGPGTHLLVTKNNTISDGDSFFLSATTSFSSSSGSQTPTYIINSSQTNCGTQKDRTLSNNNDIGNVFFYDICENLTVGNTYTFNLYVIVESGEILEQIDESFNGFETRSFNITEGNLPPIPNEITNPEDGDNVTGSDTITWREFTDPNGGIITYNISLFNPGGSFNITIENATTSLFVDVNWNDFINSTYDLVVEGCDPTGLCANTTINITLFIIPVSIPLTSTFCSDDNTLLVREVSIVNNNGQINVTIDENFILCENGCSNSSLTALGNPGCIVSDLTNWIVVLVIIIILAVIFWGINR